MGAMASSGDGTLAFIESPAQLTDLYSSELQELASTVGRQRSVLRDLRSAPEPCLPADPIAMLP